MTGQSIGRYAVLEKLGEGGMGVVYKARDTHLDRLVAIKVLPPEKTADLERKRRFVQEAKSASALNHPNIVTVYDIDNAGGADFIVMEYVAGKTLDQLIGRKGLRVADVLNYGSQVADALARAHGAGIIHRDLKPSNIMVEERGTVKVLDFGLAKLAAPPEPDADGATATLTVRDEPRTQEGMIVGTAGYMSPEQVQGLRLDGRSDIFALGAVLYEMITGRRAFRRETRVETLSAVLREEPPPVWELAKEVPPELDRIVSRCLRKERERRFQTMADLNVALRELKEESDSGRLSLSAGAAAAHPASRRWVWPAAALLAAGVAFGLWWFRPGREQAPAVLTAIPLTTTPGLELDPCLSPDGNEVVFAWDADRPESFDIYRKLIGPGAPLRLTTNPASERAPAWSPDGKWIVFARESGPQRIEVILIPALGGPERKLAEVARPLPMTLHPHGLFSWTPDSRWLAVAGLNLPQQRGLGLLSVETGEKRQITDGPDLAPAFSPNGRSLAFMRMPGLGVSDIYAVGITPQFTAEGKPRRITDDAHYTLSPVWTPDGREIIFSSGETGERKLWRTAVSGKYRRALPGAGDLAMSVSLAPRSGGRARLVYNRQLIDLNVWLAKTAPGAAAPTAIIASTYADDTAEFSPDGKRIAFGSDRSNNFEAWVCDSDGANPVQLTFFGQGVNLSMRWSPDSRRVLVYSRIADRRQLYVVDAGGGSPDVIPGAGNSNADFSADGRWIYFAQPAEGNMVLAKAAAGGTHQVLKRFPLPGTAIRTSGDGRYLYFVRDGDLWRLPLNAEGDPAGEPLRVLGPLSASLNYAVVDGGVFFIARCAGASGLCISFLDFKTSQTRRVLAIQKPIWPALSATRDGNMVAWAQIDRNESDMMLVDGFR